MKNMLVKMEMIQGNSCSVVDFRSICNLLTDEFIALVESDKFKVSKDFCSIPMQFVKHDFRDRLYSICEK